MNNGFENGSHLRHHWLIDQNPFRRTRHHWKIWWMLSVNFRNLRTKVLKVCGILCFVASLSQNFTGTVIYVEFMYFSTYHVLPIMPQETCFLYVEWHVIYSQWSKKGRKTRVSCTDIKHFQNTLITLGFENKCFKFYGILCFVASLNQSFTGTVMKMSKYNIGVKLT